MKDITEVFQGLGREVAAGRLRDVIREVSLPNNSLSGASPAEEGGDGLPPIKSFRTLIATKRVKPVEIIKGLLHRGSKMVVGGGSKSYKTWSLIDLGVSVASGKAWWGFEVNQGKVLYIDLEIQEYFFGERMDRIREAKGIDPSEIEHLDVLSLRGHIADFGVLLPKIIRRVADANYSLIILDPIYKGLAGMDENNAGDIGRLLNEIEKLAVATGAAVVFGAHFSKGNQAAKESIDRIAGSGVFARDPDTIMVMTRHEEDDSYTVECTLRNFPPVQPFVVRWIAPLMTKDGALNPAQLKQAGAKKAIFSKEQLLPPLASGPLSPGEWEKRTLASTKMSGTTFAKLRRELLADGQVELVGKKYQATAKAIVKTGIPNKACLPTVPEETRPSAEK